MTKAYFSKKIIEWYKEHYRSLPWRNTSDPYKIWLSEIILQQTRVIQGLPYYLRFVKKFSNIISLAASRERDVLRLWQGLGYYTRARNLHKCAKVVVAEFNGKFPQSFEELKQLPGIGDYTAAAIASIAFHEPVAVVDGNVYRVLSRVFGIDRNIASPEGKKFFSQFANQLIIGTESPGQYNQAIMEFGALHCLPRNPGCEDCIFRKGCFAFAQGKQNLLPVKTKKQKILKRYFYYWLLRKGEKILMQERDKKDIWKGLFDFPMQEEKKLLTPAGIVKNSPIIEDLKSLHSRVRVSGVYRHVLTHQIIFARFINIDWPTGKRNPASLLFSKARWFSRKQIEQLPKPALITRFLEESRFSQESGRFGIFASPPEPQQEKRALTALKFINRA
jgi:A/G-specific adenine glycosylase